MLFTPASEEEESRRRRILQAGAGAIAPQPPTELIAIGGLVRLFWIPSISIDITEQRIYRASISGGPYTLITTILDNTTNTYTDNTATEEIHYYYVIRAYNGVESANSNETCVVGSMSASPVVVDDSVLVLTAGLGETGLGEMPLGGDLLLVNDSVSVSPTTVDDSQTVTPCVG